MSPRAEKRCLQVAMALVLLVPLAGALAGIVKGAAWLEHAAVARDLDSHFRYLSGLLLAMVALFSSCIPHVERKAARLRLLAIFPITGGLARLYALVTMGPPGPGHQLALAIELGVVPLLVLWQARIARRMHAPR